MRQRSLAILVALTIACSAGADADRAAVAYTRGQEIYMATGAGRVVRTVHVKQPLESFAISPDATAIVFSSRESEYGGRLYAVDVASAVSKPLGLSGNYFAEEEVYSDPDFSPDGKRVAFAIHGARKGDLIEASGPFAVLDLSTGKVTILRSTMHIDDKKNRIRRVRQRAAMVTDREAAVIKFRVRRGDH